MVSVTEHILNRSLLLDLETSLDGRILKVGAIRGADERHVQGRVQKAEVARVLNELAEGADFLLGHNLLDHDLPVLRKQLPDLKLHKRPVIDTLFLSPLVFPEHPYHHLVKDYKLMRTGLNDPVEDARNAGVLFQDECAVLQQWIQGDLSLIRFYAWAFSDTMSALFTALGVEPLSTHEASAWWAECAAKYGCQNEAQAYVSEDAFLKSPEAAAYALAWLKVAGANSILPPWVHHRFPLVRPLVHRLRGTGCGKSSCAYCGLNHNPQAQLKRFFGFDAFRPEPRTGDGRSLQEAIVRCGMRDRPLLAILPTGGGKSLCFQLPALFRHQKLGMLSIVISPLQALMKDQVDNLNRQTESTFAAALYGMLTPPERGNVLERIRLGDVAVLYISPEQLRNNSFRKIVAQREIGCWIFDEAHCLSKWGHSFRTDYVYASRFIRELAQQQGVETPPVACFTATAKLDVVEEIRQHFRQELSQELELFDGGAERTNLSFEVQVVNSADKRDRVRYLLEDYLPHPEDGSSVVYCAKRRSTEEMAQWLRECGLSAEAFHAGLPAPEKRSIQEAFIEGTIQHICATNAFGMGIDKENVRLVIHSDIPGSLENYLQEAGRAGRDRLQAHCVLLYDEQDVETQFSLSSFSRLTRHDVAQILRGLRRAKRSDSDTVVITAGEILRDEGVQIDFTSEDPMATTKIQTAINMLERGNFAQRNENRNNVLQVQPLVRSLEEAEQKMSGLNLSERVRAQWLDLLGVLFNSDADRGVSADALAELPSMAVAETQAEYSTFRHDTLPVMRILNDMVQARMVEKDTLMSAYLKVRCVNAADKVLTGICTLERAMISVLREEEPDPEGWMVLSLRRLNQRLVDSGLVCAPEVLRNLLKSLSQDGQGLAGVRGSLDLNYINKDSYRVKLQREWPQLVETAEKRQAVAHIILNVLIGKVPAANQGEHLVKFNESELLEALKSDLFIAAQIRDFNAVLERGLLFLHEHKVIILQQGLAVFRQAMSITILPGAKGRSFTAGDFSSLKEHYRERNFQIHVMNKYASLGLEKIEHAVQLVLAYFTMNKAEFVKQYFAGEQEMLGRATRAESYAEIVDQLNNGVQVAVVSAKPRANMLVLAGPGSGKTRVIAHRCAYLLRVERVRSSEILVVCFNRAAAASLRKRIRELVGKDAARVTVQTYHGLAMRLIGASFSAHLDGVGELPDLDQMIPAATEMLRGNCDIPGLERDEMRERLLAGYRHILIDEYQDIDQPQYEMIAAIAGRALEAEHEETKLSILAVGDDDQNIYTFRGANIQFIRQFEKDYKAHTHYLVENYRSTAHIIQASNRLIAQNRDRMKTRHPIELNAGRRRAPPGDPVRIVVCEEALHQARFVLQEVVAKQQEGGTIAVFARTKKELFSIRAALEDESIPVVMSAETGKGFSLHCLREVVALLDLLKQYKQRTLCATGLKQAYASVACYDVDNPWCRMVDALLLEWEESTNNTARTPFEAGDFICEALFGLQRTRKSGVYLSTVHAAKGLEFDHVILLGGRWVSTEEDRRLYYVGMTRARNTLTLCELAKMPNPHTARLQGPGLLRQRAEALCHPSDEQLNLQYALLKLSDVWMDYAAVARNAPFVRQEMAKLVPGSQVSFSAKSGRLFITNKKGHAIGALSKTASETWRPKLGSIRDVRVYALIHRRKEEGLPEHAAIHLDTWEAALLEITWAGTME